MCITDKRPLRVWLMEESQLEYEGNPGWAIWEVVFQFCVVGGNISVLTVAHLGLLQTPAKKITFYGV